MPHPTQIVSALADPARLALYVRVVGAGSGGVPVEEVRAGGSRDRRRLARLADAGLVREDGDRVVADPEVFATALEEHRPVSQDPVDSLFRDGRLTALPAKRELRHRVFERITGRGSSPPARSTPRSRSTPPSCPAATTRRRCAATSWTAGT